MTPQDLPRLIRTALTVICLVTASAVAGHLAAADGPSPAAAAPPTDEAQTVIDRVEQECRDETIYMVGPAKARRLAELVREHKPKRIVECGAAIGYSGLWMARELKKLGRGELITLEISPERAKRAQANFREAGLQDYVEVTVGDARQAVKKIEGPVDFAHIDCGASNYFPCFQGLQGKFSKNAVIVADNAGISAGGMKDYLDHVRERYDSKTEWFDLDVRWAKRDAMEITVIRPRTDTAK